VKYYYAGAQRVAMRTGSSANSSVKWLLGDHLGSTSVTANYDGASPVTQLYKPWGEVRYSSGTLPTKYTYTGQYSNMSDFGLMFYNARWYDPALGRFAQADTYVPRDSEKLFNPLVTGYFTPNEIGQFNSENLVLQSFGGGKNLVPDDAMKRYGLNFSPPTSPDLFDRYAYVSNNPILKIDESGHESGGDKNVGWEQTGDMLTLWYFGNRLVFDMSKQYSLGVTQWITDFKAWANERAGIYARIYWELLAAVGLSAGLVGEILLAIATGVGGTVAIGPFIIPILDAYLAAMGATALGAVIAINAFIRDIKRLDQLNIDINEAFWYLWYSGAAKSSQRA
jgi:RHS repeat-associated protein